MVNIGISDKLGCNKNMNALYINWNPDLFALQLGSFGIRWYSMCWLIGLALAYVYVYRLFKDQKIAYEKFEPLFLYCFIGILAGARLGHCIFYQPDYFLASAKGVFEMFIPIKLFGEGVMDSLSSGQWKFIGYEGLASHGGTLGLILALVIYSRKMKLSLWFLIDVIAIATPVTACFIRLGNLMNSEIIGKPTDVPWAFIFERVDMLPRHPGQLYEAIAYAILIVIMWVIYRRTNKGEEKKDVRTDFKAADKKDTTAKSDGIAYKNRLIGTGFYFGLCLLYIFTFRFFIEWTKEDQEAFEAGMLFNMGQLLSVPFIVIGAIFTYKGIKKK